MTARFRYAELHCKTNFSFLEGASHPDELVAKAAEEGYAALAITDRNSLAGVVRAHRAAKELKLPLIIGAEITPQDAPPVVLWATDRQAYGRLCRLLTIGRRRAPKGESHLNFADIAEHAQGLIAGVLATPQSASPFENGSDLPQTVRESESRLHDYHDLFGDRGYLLLELHAGPRDDLHTSEMATLARKTRLPLLAAGGVLYHAAERLPLHDVLTATRWRMTVDAAKPFLQPNAERHLHALELIARKFARQPQAIARTLEVARQCRFSLDELRYEYPEELAPTGKSAMEYLRELTWKGAARRYPSGVPEKIRLMIEHELTLIQDLRYEAYFLTVWDLVRFARSRNILCQGRGSAANSVVCFCLGVTAVDPDRIDVLFERFISRERNEAPDIDVDFEHERREEIIQYVYEKYGRDRAGLTAVVTTYRVRSAVRDVGKAIGLSLDRVDALAKHVDGHSHDGRFAERCLDVGIDPHSAMGKRLIYLVSELVGFPRHLGQHVGGMVITRGPLCELTPIENASMEERTVVEWDKDDLDELGILKVDCLSLGMLSAIRKAFAMIKTYRGVEYTLANVPREDPRVYEMISNANTLGVFQIESRAQISMLPRLRPRCFYDLVIEVAIVRPGPIQGDMVHPYLRRRAGTEPVPEYPTPEIADVLKKTLGVPLFQEQAMKLAVVAAGFSPGEADQLRRAMGAWRRTGEIDRFHEKLVHGMLARGLDRDFAERVFNQIRGFGEYGFPESHAASFALLVYISAWLKCYEHAAFTAALINSQPMGFYAPAQLVSDARQHGVVVRPVDVNASQWDCTLEPMTGEQACRNQLAPLALRLGFRMISGLAERYAAATEQAREDRPFLSLDDFTRRSKLPQAAMKKLAEADAFASLGQDRRQMLWQSLGQNAKPKSMPLLASLDEPEEVVELPTLSLQAQVYADYRTSGLSLRGHPIGFHREALSRLRVLPASSLMTAEPDRVVRVAGIVLIRQRPATAKGITFVTLEDETGVVNLVVRQDVWQKFYVVARTAPSWLAVGKLERREGVIHVIPFRIEDLSASVGEIRTKSRDFR